MKKATSDDLQLECFKNFKKYRFKEALNNTLEAMRAFSDFEEIKIRIYGIDEVFKDECFAAYRPEKRNNQCNKVYKKDIYRKENVVGYIECRFAPELQIEEYMKVLFYFIVREIEHYCQVRILKKMANMDNMLDIKNRNALIERFNNFSMEKMNSCVGVIYLDVNDLKYVNDTYGHSEGDNLLKKVIDITKIYFDKEDIYRVGGDEFIIVIDGMEQEDFYDKCRLFKEAATQKHGLPVAIGYSWRRFLIEFADAKDEADMWMYKEKKEYHKNKQYVGWDGIG